MLVVYATLSSCEICMSTFCGFKTSASNSCLLKLLNIHVVQSFHPEKKQFKEVLKRNYIHAHA